MDSNGIIKVTGEANWRYPSSRQIRWQGELLPEVSCNWLCLGIWTKADLGFNYWGFGVSMAKNPAPRFP